MFATRDAPHMWTQIIGTASGRGYGVAMRSYEIHRDGLCLRVSDHAGIHGGSDHDTSTVPVLLLHGWPQDGSSWDGVVPLLTAAGHRVIVPELRGARPEAAPASRWAYRTSALVADTTAIIDHIGGPVHLVGHDWGSALAWYTAATHPDLVASLTAFSVPHPGAFLRALLTSRQARASWYMGAFQIPLLPERYLGRPARTARLLRHTGLPASYAEAYATRLADRRVARGGLHWYRAAALTRPHLLRSKITVPTLQVWSAGDSAITEHAMQHNVEHTASAYEYTALPGVSHWIPETAPDTTAKLIRDHIDAHRM